MGYVPPPSPMSEKDFNEAYNNLSDKSKEAIKINPKLILIIDGQFMKWVRRHNGHLH